MYVGDKKITDIRVGNKQVTRIYLGTKIIYSIDQQPLPDNTLLDSEGYILIDSQGNVLISK